MTIEEIEKEYCQEGKGVQRVKKIEDVVNGERYKGEIPNVFDQKHEYYTGSKTGQIVEETLKKFGVEKAPPLLGKL